MASLFDNLSDVDSFELYYDSDLEAIQKAWEDSDFEGDYPSNFDDEDPFRGPDLDDPDLLDTNINTSLLTSSISSLASSTISLPLHYPQPIRPPISGTSSEPTIQAFEAMTLKEPAPLKGKKQNSIGARISTLALHDSRAPFKVIEKQTQVT